MLKALHCLLSSIFHLAVKPPKYRYNLSLTGGRNLTSGIVRVNINNNLNGIICLTSWNLNAADVACRQMGYLNAYSSRGKLFAKYSIFICR